MSGYDGSPDDFGPAGLHEPGEWIGKTASWKGLTMDVDHAERALSNLPHRAGHKNSDGSPVLVPLKRVYAVTLTGDHLDAVTVYACAVCGALREQRGQVTTHLAICDGSKEPVTDYSELTVSQLIELAKRGQALERRIQILEARLRAERAARRSAEHSIKVIGNAVSRTAGQGTRA
jgi:hypothetical protein